MRALFILTNITIPLALGCAHSRPPEDTRPALELSEVADLLDGAAVVLEAVPLASSWEVCVAQRVGPAAAHVAADAVRAALDPTLPSVELDVSPCLLLRPGEEGVDVDERVGASIAAVAQLVRLGLRSAHLDCRTRSWSDAALAWLAGAAVPAVEYARDPSRRLVIAAVPVDLTQCPFES